MNPNDLGKKYLVDQCKSIDISDYLNKVRNELKQLAIKSQAEVDGYELELTTSQTHYQGLRYWFKCPMCGSRVGKLYRHPISQILGCRECLNLEYRSRRYKGMVESKT